MSQGTIRVDFNGLRLGVAQDFNEFAEITKSVLNEGIRSWLEDDFIDKFNQLRRQINVILMLQSEEQGYRDISDEIELVRIKDNEVEDEESKTT